MISPADITVVLSTVLPSREHFWMMDYSCRKFGIEPVCYGLGETAGGWLDVLWYRLHQAVKQVPTSHVLYSDSRDAFFLTGLDEISARYNDLECPPLLFSAVSAIESDACRLAYSRVRWKKAHYRYLACGGFLCEKECLLGAMGWIMEHMPGQEFPEDVPVLWCKLAEVHPGVIALDHECAIFQNVSSTADGELDVAMGRIHNRRMDSFPCLIHFNGGYSDPVTGKWAAMEDTWKSLGHTLRPPWLLNAH